MPHTKMHRLLVIPSWYPTKEDKINGCFFQAQSALLAHDFEIRVLRISFVTFPRFSQFLVDPIGFFLLVKKFILAKKTVIDNGSDRIFSNPPLYHFKCRLFGLTRSIRHQRMKRLYSIALEKMMDAGWRPHLIRAYSAYPGGVVARNLSVEYDIPYVISEHLPFFLESYPIHVRQDVKDSFVNASMVLSLSHDKVRQLGMSGILVESHIVHNFVDEKLFSNLSDGYFAGMELKIICVAAADYLKDHTTALRAVSALKKRGIPFRLSLVGLGLWGRCYDQVCEIVNQLDLTENVKIIDTLSREEISISYSKNHIFLLTSIAEGFPNAVLEAMASGLFILATRHGGTEDIISPSVGIVVNVRDYISIADALERIYLGKIQFDPRFIRDYIVKFCGREAYRSRILSLYTATIDSWKTSER